jgi:hypothetical protein
VPRAQSASLDYQGGPVLHANVTHVIFWAPSGSDLAYDPGYESLVGRFLSDVAGDSHQPTNVYSLSGQYRDAEGPAAYDSSYKGVTLVTDPLPANGCVMPPLTGPAWAVCLSDAQIRDELEHVVASDHLPTSTRDIYFLVLPNGFGACYAGGPDHCALGGAAYSGFCGYHGATGDGLIRYAVIPYNAVPPHCRSTNPRPNASTADPALSALSHEHNEIVTDPYSNAWFDSSGLEDGDLCAQQFGSPVGGAGSEAYNQLIHGGHYFLQQEWSNDDRGCASAEERYRLSFSVPRHLKGRRVRLKARGRDPDGSIVAYTWFLGHRKITRGRLAWHVFARRGSYRVLLRATDSQGNWEDAQRRIRVG